MLKGNEGLRGSSSRLQVLSRTASSRLSQLERIFSTSCAARASQAIPTFNELRAALGASPLGATYGHRHSSSCAEHTRTSIGSAEKSPHDWRALRRSERRDAFAGEPLALPLRWALVTSLSSPAAAHKGVGFALLSELEMRELSAAAARVMHCAIHAGGAHPSSAA